MISTRWLYLPTLVAMLLMLSACGTTPVETGEESDDDFVRATKTRTNSPPPQFNNVGVLQDQLGMNRQPSDLGYREKSFNPCSYGMNQDASACEAQYLTVVHFQLLCRDTEGTVSTAPVSLTPIVSPQITWSLAGQNGGTPTDRNGYGHLAVVSDRPLRGKRLILRKGAFYVGVTVGEVNKLVLPKNWCGGRS